MTATYPQRMTFTEWRRTPFRIRHRLIGVWINDRFRHWRSCADPRCRRARSCQDHACYWRRLATMSFDEQMRVRKAAEPLAKLLWIGSSLGSEGRPRY